MSNLSKSVDALHSTWPGDQEGGNSGVVRALCEGARARGVADAFDLLGLASVFLDATGTVLHVGQATKRHLGRSVAVVEKTLVGSSAETNRVLQTLIMTALGGEAAVGTIIDQGRAVEISARPVPESLGNLAQMMKVLVVFTPMGANEADLPEG